MRKSGFGRDSSVRQLKQLGEQIRRMRKGTGATQADVASRAGLDNRYYSRIERGEINVTYLTMMAITRAFRLCPGTLFLHGSKAENVKADVCILTSQMNADNNRKGLAQTAKFVKHVLGIYPKLAGGAVKRG